ncbi:uncharacterized protein IL334_003489 [Kwoniella shivajii]|uniref:Pod-specific dehydrogenase n=1 Tax=Kwoniella shivajii TaxID=564305 RepID=A0ABZ1CZD5_9TREE|nr:hypothetical protein IL334_003489 [Kwoniella shivajii]
MGFWTTLITWISFQWNAALHAGLPLVFWVRPRWSVDDIPDQSGKVVLVTGGNSGVGYATSLAFYNAGAKVYLACRNEKSAKEAIEQIQKGAVKTMAGYEYHNQKKDGNRQKGSLEFIQLDLTDLESVDNCAEEFLKKEDKLDVLFGNAGIMATPEGLYTKQGYTLQFGTNVIGHQRLISLLLPLLLTSPPTHPSRVIMTTSAGHAMAPSSGVDYKSVVRDSSDPITGEDQDPKQGKNEYGSWVEYGQSKWGNIAISKYLHNAYGRQGRLISVAVHPGLVATNLASHFSLVPYLVKHVSWITPFITRTGAVGAVNQVWAATIPDHDARWISGEYIVPYKSIGIPRPDLQDDEKVEQVWNWCEEQGRKRV